MADARHIPRDRTELLAAITVSWKAYDRILDALTDDEWNGPTDENGWTVKDHVAQVTAWENVILEAFRSGTPLWRTLQIPEAEFAAQGYATANAIIHTRAAGQPVRRARRNHHITHARLVAIIGELSEEDLRRPFAEFAGMGGDASVLASLMDLLVAHYDTHRERITGIASPDTAPG